MQFHGVADRRALGAGDAAGRGALHRRRALPPALRPSRCATSARRAARPPRSRTTSRARSSTPARAIPPGRADERDGSRADPLQRPLLRGRADWVDLNKVAIPQADEQQRLLANLIIQMNLDRTPLPRFWYLPRGEKAAVVMTGDDHANGDGTDREHFNGFKTAEPRRLLGRRLAVHARDVVRLPRHLDAGRRELPGRGLRDRPAPQHGLRGLHAGRITGDWNIQLAAFKSRSRRIAGRGRTGRTASPGATGRARRRPRSHTASGSTRTTTTGPGSWMAEPARACSPGRASRSGSPTPTAS